MEINQRIDNANEAYFGLARLLRSKNLSRKTKITYGRMIRPIMTYGSESWILKAGDAERLARLKRKILRRIFGATRLNANEYRKKKNVEFYRLYDDIDIVSHIKFSKLR